MIARTVMWQPQEVIESMDFLSIYRDRLYEHCQVIWIYEDSHMKSVNLYVNS